MCVGRVALVIGAGVGFESSAAGSSTFTAPVEKARHNEEGRPLARSTATATRSTAVPMAHDGIARQKGRDSVLGSGVGARQLSIERA